MIPRRLWLVAGAFLVFVMVVSCLVWLARTVQAGQLLWFDEPLMYWIHAQSSQGVTSVLTLATRIGGGVGVAVMTAVLTGWLVYRRSYGRAWFAVLSIAGAGVLNVWLKLLFERTRPDFWQHLVYETSYSFPSGHAMGSSALLLVCVFLAWRTRWRWWLVCGGSIFVLLVGVSRMYLGVHYPSDILAGWLVSLLWVSTLYGILYGRTKRKTMSVHASSIT